MTDIDIIDIEIPEKKIENSEIEKKVEEKLTDIKEQKTTPIKEIIQRTNEKPILKEYGVKLISKKTLNFLIISLVIFMVLLPASIIWQSFSLREISEKNFEINSNSETYNNYTHEINNEYNPNNAYEFTINNTIILPEELVIKLINETE